MTSRENEFHQAADIAAELGLLSPSEQWAQEQMLTAAQQAADAAPKDAEAQARLQLVTEIAHLVYRDKGGKLSDYEIDGYLPAGTNIQGIGFIGEETSVHLEAEIHDLPMSPASAVGSDGSIGGGPHPQYRNGRLGERTLGYHEQISLAARYGNILRERRDLAARASADIKNPPPLPAKK